ncbi:MAG: FtsK/SpoIIIE domain-containing protein [Sciscionella sp.]
MASRRRARIKTAFETFRSTIASTLAAADNEHAAARTAYDRCEYELSVLQAGVDNARREPELLELARDPVRGSVLAASVAKADGILAGWSAAGPDTLAALVADEKAQASWQPWEEWLGNAGKLDGDEVPALWRIGATTPEGTGEFPVAVPLLDSAHLYLSAPVNLRARAERLVEYLLLRVVGSMAPGRVRLHVWDTAQLTGSLPGMRPLAKANLLTAHDPTRLGPLLDKLSDDIRTIHDRMLLGGHSSAAEYARATGNNREPWQIAVLFGNGEPLETGAERALQRIARNGPAAGVALVLVDIPLVVNSAAESVELLDERTARCSMTGRDLVVGLDEPPPADRVTAACATVADVAITGRGRPPKLADLLPAQFGSESSEFGLRGVIGRYEGNNVELVIGDATPHVLVGGPSGSGKTNFLYAMLGSLTSRYSPDELELYLMDFKEGVSFAQFAPGVRDPSWLPHAKLVGVNVNTDREFGLALLEYLGEELRRRANAAKSLEVSKLEELKTADPEGTWPRILAVVDEFQCLFAERDAVTATATRLLEDIARRGRSAGIHLVLASQDVAGIEAFWGKPAIFEQFTLRVALPKARRVLAENNNAALEIPRWHAVVNHDSGLPHGNQQVRIPESTAEDAIGGLRERLFEHYAPKTPPRLFDGSDSPQWTDGVTRRATAVVGQRVDLAGSAATVELAAEPGRHLAVLGSAWRDSLSVVCSAALALGEDADSRFTIVAATKQAVTVAEQLAGALRGAGRTVRPVSNDLDDVLARTATELAGSKGGEHHLVLLAVDAAQSILERKDPVSRHSPGDDLREILKYGPERGCHVLGWWRSVSRLKAALGIGPNDDIGAWVGFDVHGQELSALAAGQVIDWAPRQRRGLFFDRATHARPEVIIPFDVSALIPALGEDRTG